jgi:RNA polymerase sigma-70 factor, ECF subfamily
MEFRSCEESMAQSDRSLVEHCLDGHSDDFRFFVKRYQKALLTHLRGRLKSPGQAEEAAQETFVRAFFKLRMLRQPDSFFPWLLGIANHVAQESNKRQIAERGLISSLLPDKVPVKEPGTATPYDHALECAISKLADPLQQVILLRFYAECSCNEVAQRLGVPLGTVTKHLSRAYAEIRKYLEADSITG